MSSYESRLRAAIGTSWVGATPGLRLQVRERGRLCADLALGSTYDFYDWASLTKIVFSVSAVIEAVELKRIRLNERVSGRLEFFADAGPRAREATVASLLSHSAGLTWWEPFYEKIDLRTSRSERWARMRELLADAVRESKPAKPFKAVYSDLDFLSLGYVLEHAFECSLREIWSGVRDRLDLRSTDFHPDNEPGSARERYAPTEAGGFRATIDPSLGPTWGEGASVQGEVHDENAWALGGIAPHAGLFGTMDDLGKYGLALRKSWLGETRSGLGRPETVARFAKRALPRATGDWALGFMMPSKVGSSAGRYFSPRSIGHTGFTGTSLWLDPQRDLLVTILSNRVHPTRANNSFVELRGRLHNWCVECL